MSEEDLQLRLMHELIKGSIQRCRCSAEQLEEAKKAMFKVFHRAMFVFYIPNLDLILSYQSNYLILGF